ncbi:hypothetical protein Clacol_002770 [Clathrus columnatus]|uniref:Uncharacterized protein n=1 Tax=Clathrus columnatus TaxID=1419009 RepID=A0AAV5A1P4_9AGAM|nr:hypothetical protein Clacol_002770 [Clathrus columnatus]
MPSLTLSASYISKAHTICASSAFLIALLIGSKLHYRKIVKNDVAGYPDEWWPSVSATSSDDHETHDILMISYIVLNLPWMVGSIIYTPKPNTTAFRKRILAASTPSSPYLDSTVEQKNSASPKITAETTQKDNIYLNINIWELSFSGQEMSLASVLFPFSLRFYTVSSYFDNHRGQTILQFVSVMGLIAYAHPNPLIRLFIVSLANMAGSLLKTLEWRNPASSNRQGIMLILGLALSSLSKLVNHTVNPVWSIADSSSGGWNKTGIFLGLLAAWNYATREGRKNHLQNSSEKSVQTHGQRLRGSWILASVGLGGLLFSLQCFLSDADTMVVYSWTGYPVKGPVPGGVHAYLTLIAMSLGVFISLSSYESIVKNPLWIIVGPVSAFFMYRERDWKSYYGGLSMAVFLCSLSPIIIQNASIYGKSAPSKVYGTAWLTYCVLILANVWTVAYAFVPAGWILRERTDM